MNYPMIEKLNLDVTCDKHYGCFVHANDLETLLQSAQRVYGGHQGYKGTERVPLVWSTEDDGDNSHESIVIGIREIKREPIKIEERYTVNTYTIHEISVPEQLRKKKFKVIFEEVL